MLESGSRYIIGIDLGTTNSCVSYVDTNDTKLPIQMLRIPQVVSPGYVEAFPTLPSFCYLSADQEWPAGSVKLPWKTFSENIVGQLAQTQGAKVPTRLVQSAKSWLCHSSTNRKAKILPFEAADAERKLSPVEATAEYLLHIRSTWNHLMAKGTVEAEFDQQDVILTVPASFDEISRRLTIEAAKLAGYNHLTLLEEPQAAFYCWIASKKTSTVQAGETILVCDVGGGTTDFSLIEVHENEGKLVYNRMAVGDHLLLGGDNMDATIAHFIEQKITQETGKTDFQTTQWLQLKSQARSIKEQFFGVDPKQELTVLIQGSGSSVIKGSLSTQIKRSEIVDLLLEGFFGIYSLNEALKLQKFPGFRTMGLPFEEDPSITKHLATFLQRALVKQAPQHVLFNGGSMKPAIFQQRIMDSLARWFPGSTSYILDSVSLDLAVARGAAYYGKARRGLGERIGGGIPKAYYLGIDIKNAHGSYDHKALTLLPRGTEEGTSFEPEQVFGLRPNMPVSFTLYSSQVRLNDKKGEIIAIDEKELHSLPPIHTLLRLGKSASNETIPVRLHIGLTAIGTLELWLQSQNTEHRWALEFQMRSSSGQENSLSAVGEARQDEIFDSTFLDPAKQFIKNLYTSPSKAKVMESIEDLIRKPRKEWSSSILRNLFDALISSSSNRKINADLEARWWNMAGFFLRPGFGYPLDDFRIKELWKIILQETKQKKANELQIQQWICFRRIAGGFNKGQQNQLANEIVADLPLKNAKITFKSKNEEYTYSEKIRAFASFEYLDLSLKTKVAKFLLSRIATNQAIAADYWSLGRIAARHLLYGSVTDVIPASECAKIIDELLKLSFSEPLSHLFVQLARKTDQREINLPQALIESILVKIAPARDYERCKSLLTTVEKLSITEQEEVFGDKLPAGIILDN